MGIHVLEADNPLKAHNAMCTQLVYGTRLGVDFDWTHGTEVGLHNISIWCPTVDFNFNFKKMWIAPTRWKLMVRQYIDGAALDDCLDKIEERMAGKYAGSKGRGIAVMRTGEGDFDDDMLAELDLDHDDISYIKTRMVQGRGVGRGVRRRWGSCMLNLSFRSTPVPTISLHSRTTYFGYLALMDAAVARTFAHEVSAVTGIPVEKMEFVWTLDLAQFHGFRSLAWMLGHEARREQLIADVPNRLDISSKRVDGNQVGYRKALDGFARIKQSDDRGTLYGDESFSSFARVRRRFHTEVYGVDYANQFVGGTRNRGGKGSFPELPDLWVRDLDFSCLPQTGGVADIDEEDELDDDED